MSRRTIAIDVEDGTRYNVDNWLTTKWLDGHYSGLSDAVRWLKERAVVLFRDGKHEQAIAMDRLAGELLSALDEKMRRAARDHERDYPHVMEPE